MQDFLNTLFGKILSTLVIAAVPVVELRGAIPWAYAQGLSWSVAMVAAIVGNMLPVPFILLFIRKIFLWMKDRSRLAGVVYRLEKRALAKAESVYKYQLIGLCILVAIPLPGTGAWTGALIAALLDLRLRTAIPAIGIGVVVAAVLVSGMTYGFFHGMVQTLGG